MALPALQATLREDVLVAQPIREEVRALRLAKMDSKLNDSWRTRASIDYWSKRL